MTTKLTLMGTVAITALLALPVAAYDSSSSASAEDMAEDTDTLTAAEVMAGAEDVASDALDAAEDTANAAQAELSEAGEAIANTASDAGAAAMDAAGDMVESVQDAANDLNVGAQSDIAADADGANAMDDAEVASGTLTSDDVSNPSQTVSQAAEIAAESEFMAFEGMTVADVVGMNVEGQDGGIVGEIDYIIERAGEMQAVIGVGGFLGLGEYTVALPLDAFQMQDDQLKLNMQTEEELRNMPEIDESEIEPLAADRAIM